MIDKSTRKQLAERKERVRRRINTKVDPENYEFIPAKKPIDYYDNDIRQRVAVYARVSTDNVQQTSSYELQKKYYEDFVVHHPNWTLVKIYADEGISGTSLAHRDEFNSMIADCRSGKIDMIITKSVSRFARNVVDCISMVRMLAELPSPVGVFFESECIFSLKDDSQMALSFQATMAQEESHIRSRSMETSLRMRLDGGLPLTPKLLGYYQASASIHPPDEQQADASLPSSITLVPGDFDMRGFEIARSEFFDNYHRPYVLFQDKRIKFSTTCVRSFGKDNHVELLVNPVEMKFAVRTVAKSSRNAVVFSKLSDGKYQPREIAGAAYVETLFQLFGWSPDLKYRIAGALFQTETESAYIFDVNDAEAFIKSYLLSGPKSTEQAKEPVQPLSVSGKRVRAVPEEWIGSFGKQYYLHQQSFPPVCDQSEEDWKIRMEGQLYETGQKLRVTGFDVLRDYICQELGQHGKEES